MNASCHTYECVHVLTLFHGCFLSWFAYRVAITYTSRRGWSLCTPIVCLIFISHFLQNSPIIDGSVVERELQLKASYVSLPLCTIIGTANCIWSVIQSQSPISILLVSFRRNVAKETWKTRSSIEIWERRNNTPNAIGWTYFDNRFLEEHNRGCDWCTLLLDNQLSTHGGDQT